MKVNLDSVKKQSKTLEKIYNDYNDIYEDTKEAFLDLEPNWTTNTAKKFYSNTDKQELDMKNTLQDIENMLHLYVYILNSYQDIGKSIFYDERNKDRLMSKLNRYISKLNTVINMYGSINKSDMTSSERATLNSQKYAYKNDLSNINRIKYDLNNIINVIENTETHISSELNDINISDVSLDRKIIGG